MTVTGVALPATKKISSFFACACSYLSLYGIYSWISIFDILHPARQVHPYHPAYLEIRNTMASISASTTHKVKKTTTTGGKKAAGGGILKSGTSSKIKGSTPSSSKANGNNISRRGSAPKLLPSELNHTTSLNNFLSLSSEQLKDRVLN